MLAIHANNNLLYKEQKLVKQDNYVSSKRSYKLKDYKANLSVHRKRFKD